jgi:hypothetical protein
MLNVVTGKLANPRSGLTDSTISYLGGGKKAAGRGFGAWSILVASLPVSLSAG